jgi:putative SOS response-associated peptidase YedK
MFLPDQQPIAFAGLWEAWQPKDAADDQSTYESCTIITREASSSVRDIHHRMPVILKPEAYDRWLNPEIQQTDYLQKIIDTEFIRKLKYFPVSKMVNRVQNNSPECIHEVDAQRES